MITARRFCTAKVFASVVLILSAVSAFGNNPPLKPAPFASRTTMTTTSSSCSSSTALAATTSGGGGKAIMSPEVKVGDKIPIVELRELLPGQDKPNMVNIVDLIKDRKVCIIGLPGAFTPGCSKSHLPSFIKAREKLRQKGVEMIIAVTTNDPYVMEVRCRRCRPG